MRCVIIYCFHKLVNYFTACFNLIVVQKRICYAMLRRAKIIGSKLL